MSNVISIGTGEPVLTKQEQIEIVQDMFEELVAFVVNECPTLSDMGVDDALAQVWDDLPDDEF